MNLIDKISRLLLAPPATGPLALFYGIALVATPTGLRLLLAAFIESRLPFFAYMPFIILAAALLDWKGAAAVALGSWVVADFLFMAPTYQLDFGTIEIVGLITFSASAFLIIALVEAVRTIVDNSLRPVRPGGFTAPVVFSLQRGQAWVSWYGSHSWVRLGPEDEVAEMMQDFLAQRELGRRLTGQSSPETATSP